MSDRLKVCKYTFDAKWNVIITQGNEESVKIETDAKFIEDIKTTVRNGTLRSSSLLVVCVDSSIVI